MGQHNVSFYSDEQTARTCLDCAQQRAENLYVLGVSTVLELCVGPSLKQLEASYAKYNIQTTGNDIDARWKDYYPKGKWLIGDATKLPETNGFDAVVVAPPLSIGCQGSRNTALSLHQVTPAYENFLNLTNKIVVFVLPGKTLSIKEDKKQLHKFLSKLSHGTYEVVPLKRKVNKYIDIYWKK